MKGVEGVQGAVQPHRRMPLDGVLHDLRWAGGTGGRQGQQQLWEPRLHSHLSKSEKQKAVGLWMVAHTVTPLRARAWGTRAGGGAER